MLNAVIKFSLRHRSLVVVACLVVLGYGGYLACLLYTSDAADEL